MTTARPACWWCYAFYYIEETAPRAQVQTSFLCVDATIIEMKNEPTATTTTRFFNVLHYLFLIFFGAHAERYNIRKELLVDIELEQRKK